MFANIHARSAQVIGSLLAQMPEALGRLIPTLQSDRLFQMLSAVWIPMEMES
jgi:hypothetical protein